MLTMHNIPVLHVAERTLAAAYEKALLALREHGVAFQTQYDKPGDPPSLDCTMSITVHEPLADPMIHKAFPGGIEDLREYVMEVQGAKDHWVKNMNDPKDTRWEYTYHGRLATTSFDERVYNLSDEMIREMYDEAEAPIRAKIAEYDRTH